MEPRIFHGTMTVEDVANSLISYFNRGNFKVQQLQRESGTIVQIATYERTSSGGQTALSVNIQKVEDGISIQIGKQALLGVAASLGKTAFTALRNPLGLLGRLDDIAQDIESLQLSEEVWRLIEETARQHESSYELSERLRRITCSFCMTANSVGESNCIACGAPLGEVQPRTCLNCGFVITGDEIICPNCNKRV
jgi:hypothetical protein